MQKYPFIMRVFHWVLVIMFAAQFIFHNAISDAYDQIQRGVEVAFNPLVAGHVFGGLAILVLTLVRFGIRRKSVLPAYPEQGSALTKRASEIVHYGTYVLGTCCLCRARLHGLVVSKLPRTGMKCSRRCYLPWSPCMWQGLCSIWWCIKTIFLNGCGSDHMKRRFP